MKYYANKRVLCLALLWCALLSIIPLFYIISATHAATKYPTSLSIAMFALFGFLFFIVVLNIPQKIVITNRYVFIKRIMCTRKYSTNQVFNCKNILLIKNKNGAIIEKIDMTYFDKMQ
jgi:hypothetical protein